MSEFTQRPPFFMVYNASTGHTRKRHKTVEAAEEEAKRMADLYPYAKFHVLVSLGRATGTTNERRAFRKTPAYEEYLKARKERRGKKKALAEESNKR